MHFMTSCNRVCEWNVSWKTRFSSPEKPQNLVFAQVLENKCFNVCTNADCRVALLKLFCVLTFCMQRGISDFIWLASCHIMLLMLLHLCAYT